MHAWYFLNTSLRFGVRSRLPAGPATGVIKATEAHFEYFMLQPQCTDGSFNHSRTKAGKQATETRFCFAGKCFPFRHQYCCNHMSRLSDTAQAEQAPGGHCHQSMTDLCELGDKNFSNCKIRLAGSLQKCRHGSSVYFPFLTSVWGLGTDGRNADVHSVVAVVL